NEFSRVILVHQRIRALVIDGEINAREPAGSASFYLVNALLPVPEEKRDTYHLAVATTRPESASEGSLVDQDICFLVNVKAAVLTKEFVDALKSFVRSGKGLLITSGDNIVAADYNSILGDLLPSPLLDYGPYHPPKDDPASPDLESINVNSFLSRFKEKG